MPCSAACSQVGSQAALVQDGQVLQQVQQEEQEAAGSASSSSAADSSLPVLLGVDPPCTCPATSTAFTLHGRCFFQAGASQEQEEGEGAGELEVVVRCEGRHLKPLVLQQHTSEEAGCGHAVDSSSNHSSSSTSSGRAKPEALHPAAVDSIQCTLPDAPGGCHLLQLELCKQGYLSAAVPLLLVDEPDLAAEISGSGVLQALPAQEREALLRDIAAVLQQLAALQEIADSAAQQGQQDQHQATEELAVSTGSWSLDRQRPAAGDSAVASCAAAKCGNGSGSMGGQAAADGVLQRALSAGSVTRAQRVLDFSQQVGWGRLAAQILAGCGLVVAVSGAPQQAGPAAGCRDPSRGGQSGAAQQSPMDCGA